MGISMLNNISLDLTTIVADSVRMGIPIIAVSIQYRLNVFALGSDDGPPNLALRDQELALHWVQDHIAGFGGNPVLSTRSSHTRYCLADTQYREKSP
jgi:carboxylesterase type B